MHGLVALQDKNCIFFYYFFQIEVHEELADADKISANGSDLLGCNSDQDPEDAALTGNGNGYQNGNCQEIRHSTIMFVIKSNQDLTKTASQQIGSKPSPIRGLIRQFISGLLTTVRVCRINNLECFGLTLYLGSEQA